MEREMETHFGNKLDEGAQFILFPEVRSCLMNQEAMTDR